MALAEGLWIKWRTEAARHLDLLAQLRDRRLGKPPQQLGIVETAAANRLDDPIVGVTLDLQRSRAISTSSRNFATAALGSRRSSSGSSRPLQRTGSTTRSWALRSNNRSALANR